MKFRPRFSLRTLAIVVTLVCAYFGAWEATKKYGIRRENLDKFSFAGSDRARNQSVNPLNSLSNSSATQFDSEFKETTNVPQISDFIFGVLTYLTAARA